MAVEITTVADDLIVAHDGTQVERLVDLSPDSDYVVGNGVGGQVVHTLARPDGELLCRIGTVNDLHFGEVEAGRVDDHEDGPVRRVEPGATAYPVVMNRAAVAEMSAVDLAAVIVKGDVSTEGTDDEFATFESIYGPAFGDRLHTVRGNHDAASARPRYEGDRWIELPGVAIALLDTAVASRPNGSLSSAQLAWLDDCAAAATSPVIVMGHHQQWIGNGRTAAELSPVEMADDYFGIDRTASDALAAVIERRPAIVAYASGHTHRHRVRRTARGVPSIEVGCVKDFPGTWAEYRVYETAVLQVVHRISSPEALAWSEKCRDLYSDFGLDYTEYALGTLQDRCFTIPFS